ncbi:MAG: VWA domain-containing protein [Candidatus Caenarcaniphilales bacterium]|nr:VWA domain-containing protein [Candidatus Caenarcaniphilales bacterium]
MSFANPVFFLLLILIPILIYLYLKKSSINSLQISLAESNLGLTNIIDKISFHIPFIFRILCLCIIITALARPQFGQSFSTNKNLGLDIILAVDTSQSMSALDLKINDQAVDRLTVVKKILSEFILKRSNDRLGLIVFGDEAYTQCPITRDYGALLDLVNYIDIGIAGKSTAIGSAIALAVKRLKDLKAKSKVLILMTDGQNTSGSISPITASKLAKEYQIKIYTIGIGQDGEVPFIVDTPFGKKAINQSVTIDEETLIEIAESTSGKYYRAESTEELKAIYSEIDKLEKTEVEVREYTNYKDIYEYFLWIAFSIFLFEITLSNTILKRV